MSDRINTGSSSAFSRFISGDSRFPGSDRGGYDDNQTLNTEYKGDNELLKLEAGDRVCLDILNYNAQGMRMMDLKKALSDRHISVKPTDIPKMRDRLNKCLGDVIIFENMEYRLREGDEVATKVAKALGLE